MEMIEPTCKCRNIVDISLNILGMIDLRLVDHGKRVAYIVDRLYNNPDFFESVEGQCLFVLALFHDIGAYKTEEIDRMFEFETQEIANHSVYGYLFIKEFTPLCSSAESILYHHIKSKYFKSHIIESDYADYAQLIHFADRIDILISSKKSNEEIIKSVNALPCDTFDKKYIEAFNISNIGDSIIDAIKDGSYNDFVEAELNILTVKKKSLASFMEMLAFLIDFRSVFTVTHTATTASITQKIAEIYGFDEEKTQQLYYAALLHDVGKVATPLNILESTGKLSDDEMAIMRRHVTDSYRIINGHIDDCIVKTATRHHEKLDGSGYPNGLTADDLTVGDRILAIADITSALVGVRSYKQSYSMEKVQTILIEMADKGLICKEIVALLIDNYDEIIDYSKKTADKIKFKYELIAKQNIDLQHQLSLYK